MEREIDRGIRPVALDTYSSHVNQTDSGLVFQENEPSRNEDGQRHPICGYDHEVAIDRLEIGLPGVFR